MGNPARILDGRCILHIGDVVERLREMPRDWIDTVVTSPPYWGLRDYGTAIWIGGDPACDHVVGSKRSGLGLANHPATTRGGAIKVTETPEIKARKRCPHCGAERKDYQIGLEPTLAEHIEVMVAVFREIRRVLKPTGTVWLNYGDCYATRPNGRSAAAGKAAADDDRTFRDKPVSTVGTGALGEGYMDRPFRDVVNAVKDKDLCMVPNVLALALRADGWHLRSEIVWGKPNPMPDSSGSQRPSTAHEKIFLLTKSTSAEIWRARDTGELSMRPDLTEQCEMITARDAEGRTKIGPRWLRIGSHYDASAVMQPSSPNTHARISQDVARQAGSTRAHGGTKANGPMKAVVSKLAPDRSGGVKNNAAFRSALSTGDATFVSGKVKGALVGARPPGTAAHTGIERAREKWREERRGLTPRHEGQINHTGLDDLGRGQGRLLRNYEAAPLPVWRIATKPFPEAHFATFPPELAALCISAGSPPADGRVLDPFGGAGTTALVALRMGRRAELIELSPTYAAIARRRLERDWMGPEERARALARDKAEANPPDPGPLFHEAAE